MPRGPISVLAVPSALRLLDHLVSGRQQRFRDGEAEKLGRLKVDDELELGRLQHRQVGGLGAIEDIAGIDTCQTLTVQGIGSVAHQSASYDKITDRISRRNPVAHRQGDQLRAAANEECVGHDEEGIRALAREGGKDRIDLAACARVEDMDFQPDDACSAPNF